MRARRRTTRRATRRLGALILAVGLLLGVAALPAAAHPLGNFTTNSYLGISIAENRITFDHVLDLAEIPTVQAMQGLDLDDDGAGDDDELAVYRRDACEAAASGVELLIDGEPQPVRTAGDGALTFPPGEAGLDTLRLECRLVAEHVLADGASSVEVTQPAPTGRIGWREITLVGDGVTVLEADVPQQSLSRRLTNYPEEQLASPVEVVSAVASVRPGGPSGMGLPLPEVLPDGVSRGVDRISDWFTGLVAVDRLTVPFALLAGLVAVGLGTLHALAPGHGKTVMAAYLVGRQGTTRDALTLGATVAITHTLGVFLLGVVLSASQTASPEAFYPWLGAGSGLLFALVGVTLLRQALRGGGHDHSHGPAHTQAHGGHTHDRVDRVARHDPATNVQVVQAAAAAAAAAAAHGDLVRSGHGHGHGHEHGHAPERTSSGWRSLLAPGLAGGLVPSPSALLVLLGGFAIGRAWFGVALVIAYGIGMAATLVGAGLLLLRARTRLQQAMNANGRWSRAAPLFRWLPVITSSAIVLGGLVIGVRSLMAL